MRRANISKRDSEIVKMYNDLVRMGNRPTKIAEYIAISNDISIRHIWNILRRERNK